MEKNVIEFKEETVKNYLDNCITFWRNKRDKENSDTAKYYVDAFQSVRSSLFGECLGIIFPKVPPKPTPHITSYLKESLQFKSRTEKQGE